MPTGTSNRPDEMERRFAAFPDAIRATADIARRCTFDLGELQLPISRTSGVIDGLTAQEALEQLTEDAVERDVPGRRARSLYRRRSITSCG